MKIWEYILIAIGVIAIIAGIYYLIKKLIKEVAKIHHLPLREKGLTAMPAVPFILSQTVETIVKLGLRGEEFKMAKAGLSTEYTIQGETQSAYTFMYDDAPLNDGEEDRKALLHRLDKIKEKDFLNQSVLDHHLTKGAFSSSKKAGKTFTDLFLDNPKHFSLSWTTYYNVYQDNVGIRDEEYAAILKDPDEATKQFWPMISENGLAYNLLILQKVKGACLEKTKTIFQKDWDKRFKPLQEKGLLYAIDLTIFNHWDASQVDGFDRWTPGAFILLEQDKDSKKTQPVGVQISKKDADATQIYTRENTTDATWIFALSAARTAVTVYGIWLGHVYHWHIVSAAMQMTLFNNIDESHNLRKLLDPQSNSLIGFNDADDDPEVTLAKFGIHKENFSDKEDWDRYPIAKHLLYFWQTAKDMAAVFVDTTYTDDKAVFEDTQLQNWIIASSDPEEGNIRGLPVMSGRKELKEVLTSVIYRVVAHGNSRQMRSLGPGLSFVANYPPCLQR